MKRFLRPLTAVLLPIFVLSSCILISGCVIVVSDGGGWDWGHWAWDEDHVRGSGDRIEETRDVASFDAVKLWTAADVVVHVGHETSLTVSGDDNILPHLTTEVSDGELVLDLPGRYRPRAGLRVEIGTPTLEHFDLSGSGEVEIHGASGPALDLLIRGSGDLEVRGEVSELTASIAGSGNMDLEQLNAERASVSVSGSGDLRVHATERVDYSISGSGDVTVSGGPNVFGSISGSGAVRQK